MHNTAAPPNHPLRTSISVSTFPHLFRGESFRTIDPITTTLRHLVQHGPLLPFPRPQGRGAVSCRRHPPAGVGNPRRGLRTLHISRTEFRTARPAQALPLGNPLPIPCAHRGKARFWILGKHRVRSGKFKTRARAFPRLQIRRRAAQRRGHRLCRRGTRHPPATSSPQDCLILLRIFSATFPFRNSATIFSSASAKSGVLRIRHR